MKKMGAKAVVVALAGVLALGGAVGGTIAWLTDKSGPVTNTFTVGNIDIELGETTTTYKMVPGATIAKDPKVTVKADSEACWVFVKVTEDLGSWEAAGAKFSDYLTYTVLTTEDADGCKWTPLGDAYPGVYYIDQAATTADEVYHVIAGDQVTVKTSVTKGDMDKLQADGATLPTLTFQAYAIQKASFDTAQLAWAEVSRA